MENKNFILNADGFGLSKHENQAVLEGYINGFLTSASLCVNSDAFNSAVHDIIPDCPNLGVGIQLNILTNKALTPCSLLTNSNNEFDKSFWYVFFNRKKQELLTQIETEFKAQIEKAKNETKICHINSKGHIHAIPEVFEIVCKLATEYDSPYIRTCFEELYFVPQIITHINLTYFRNLITWGFLQRFSKHNKKIAKKYNIKTNDYIIGINYKNLMSKEAIESGLRMLDQDCIVECVINPCKYGKTRNNRTEEFLLTQDMTFKDTISRLGYNLTNYKTLN